MRIRFSWTETDPAYGVICASCAYLADRVVCERCAADHGVAALVTTGGVSGTKPGAKDCGCGYPATAAQHRAERARDARRRDSDRREPRLRGSRASHSGD